MIDGKTLSRCASCRTRSSTTASTRASCGATRRVAACDRMPDLAEACDVLRAWNVRDDLDSRGALLFRRFAQRLLGGGPASAPPPFEVPFDAADPANTPRGLRTEDPRGARRRSRRGQRAARARASRSTRRSATCRPRCAAASGSRSTAARATAGVFNAINVARRRPEGEDGLRGRSRTGRASCRPCSSSTARARSSRARSSPTRSRPTRARRGYSDQTRMFSRKEWNAAPFCAADVLARDDLDDAARRGQGVRGADRAGQASRRGGAGAACGCAGPAAGARRSTSLRGGRRVARVNGRGGGDGAGATSGACTSCGSARRATRGASACAVAPAALRVAARVRAPRPLRARAARSRSARPPSAAG